MGEVAEWSKAAVLKTARVKALVGSNPTLSATWIPIQDAPGPKSNMLEASIDQGGRYGDRSAWGYLVTDFE